MVNNEYKQFIFISENTGNTYFKYSTYYICTLLAHMSLVANKCMKLLCESFETYNLCGHV